MPKGKLIKYLVIRLDINGDGAQYMTRLGHWHHDPARAASFPMKDAFEVCNDLYKLTNLPGEEVLWVYVPIDQPSAPMWPEAMTVTPAKQP